jgi:rhomboid protease GluP
MKTNYMDMVYSVLIEKEDYMPITDANGKRIEFEGMRIAQKVAGGKLTVVELIDADRLSEEQIRNKLEMNRNNLGQMGNATVFAFQVFIFDSKPEEAKLQSIKEGQLEDVYTRKYLPCVSVDLENKEVTKLYELPIKSKDLENALNLALVSDNAYDNISIEKDKVAIEEESTDEFKPITLMAKVPFLTYALIVINIVVWLLMNGYAKILNIGVENLFTPFGAKENFRIIAGEYWRFLTPVFLHADIKHLLMNCLSLFVFGKIVEGLYGHKKFAFIYLASGIMGNIASFMFSPHSAVGASGAIFGLLGALIYFSVENPKICKRYFGNDILIMVVVNLVYGFVSPGIDNFGHVGGLIGGFLTSGIVKVKGVSNKLLGRPVFIAATVIVLAAGLYYGFNLSGNYKYYEFIELTDANKLEEAVKKGEEIIAMKLIDSDIKLNALYNVAILESSEGNYEAAIEKAKLVKDMDISTGHFLSGIVYYNDQQYELAREELSKAKLDPNYKERADKLIEQIDKINQ